MPDEFHVEACAAHQRHIDELEEQVRVLEHDRSQLRSIVDNLIGEFSLKHPSSAYISDTKTTEECLQNVEFQLENVKGWMKHGVRDLAEAKAICLETEVRALLRRFRGE